MDRYIFKSSLIAIALFLGVTQEAKSIDIVHDMTSFPTFEAILNTTKETVKNLGDMTKEIQSLDRALGNKIAPGLMNRLSQASVYSQEFSGLMDTFNGQGDPLSRMNYIGQQHLGARDCSNYLYAKDYFQQKLFPVEGTIKADQLQTIQSQRLDAMQTSTVDSLAMATHQKRTLPKDHQALKDLSAQANADDTIQYQMGVQTRLLEQIAYRLEKMIAIQSQQLELMGAYMANIQPAVFKRSGGTEGSR